MGPLIPLFGLLVMSALGFKARVDPHLSAFLPAHNQYLRFTSGASSADLLVASMVADRIPNMPVAEVGCGDSIGRPPAQ